MLDNQVLPFHNLGQRIKDLFRKKANKKTTNRTFNFKYSLFMSKNFKLNVVTDKKIPIKIFFLHNYKCPVRRRA